jgi:2-methylcitrate dehydratase PrpD
MPSATELFVRWAWSLRPEDIPDEVRRAARRHLLDGVGTALAASRLDAAPYALEVARQLGGPAEASIIGGERTSAPVAAFANGMLMHALDYDDTHAESLVHVTVAVAPAALAAAERRGAAGARLVTAIVAGSELVTRLGSAVRHGFHKRGFHATSVCGVFASALAAALLDGMSEEDAVSALGIAGSFASGSLQFLDDGTETKPLHAGWAAHAGIMAARLAAAGATGPRRILEGQSGLFRSYAGQEVGPDTVTDGLGTRWETARVTLKPYPACQLSHATLDAVRVVRERITSVADIEAIDVEIPDESAATVSEPVATKLHPRTPYDAKFSLQWCVAALLIDGRLDVGSFTADQLDRPEVLRLAARVHGSTYRSPVVAASAPGRVAVRLRDGRVERAEVPTSTGSPASPLSDADVFRKLAENVGDAAHAERLAAAVNDLERAVDIERLASLLRERAPAFA